MQEETAVQWLIEYVKQNIPCSESHNSVFEQALEKEVKQTRKFGELMQMVRDVDCDGNVEFMFNPNKSSVNFLTNEK